MTRLQRLKREARATAMRRGHTLTRFESYRGWAGSRAAYALCRYCGADVTVRTNPAPNEIETSGAAVALNCDNKVKA